MKNLLKYLSLIALAGATTIALAAAEDEPKKNEIKKAQANTEEPSNPAGESKADPPRKQRPGGPGGLGRRQGGPGDRNRPQGPPPFSEIDSNNDGSVSKDEWTAFHVARAKERAERSFGHVDADQSGSLTEEEVKTAMSQFRDRMLRGGASGDGKRRPGPPGADDDRRPGPPPAQGGNRPPRPAPGE